MSLEKLREEGLAFAKCMKSDRFSGLAKLLTDLYPDNAHFIYELLQNSEDAKASDVLFTLTKDCLEFEHNGKRLFSLDDVASITSIGDSNKRDDPTNIGKFGIGFKAVFAYTTTPEIHSGEYHFRIHDLVVPETDGVNQLSIKETQTCFTFPFNHSAKTPSIAVEEIQRGLCTLSDNTLLFLNHIRRIEYLLPDGTLGYLKRVDHEPGHIEIISEFPGLEETRSHWLRYQKEVEVTDEDGTMKQCRVAIAYRLEPNDKKDKENVEWKIVPLDEGQVSIYFPAEKETSKLKFHIHAPFASTVARDSVRDCDANRQLRDGIAELVVESLEDIRDRGMLAMSFLAVLPNEQDSLKEFYQPIRIAAVNAFREKSLTPTRSGIYAPASKLYRGPSKICAVLADDDLSLFTEQTPPLWAANPPQQNQREDLFLKSLRIKPWGWSELSEALDCYFDQDQRNRIETWVSQKTDAWMTSFYALLGEGFEKDELSIFCHDIMKIKWIRVVCQNNDTHVLPTEAFLPPDEMTSFSDDIKFVKPSVYEKKGVDAKNNYALVFLNKVGVRKFDSKAMIELKLTRYGTLSLSQSRKNDHCRDMEEFIEFHKNNPKEVGIFKNKRFLRSETKTDFFCTPEEICLDWPFLNTGLADFTYIHKKYPLWHGYNEKIKKSLLKDFVDFLRAAGAMQVLHVIEAETHKNPFTQELKKDWLQGARWTHTSICEDFTIDALDKYLVVRSVNASRLIWLALVKADSKTALARFRPNQEYVTRTADSQLVHHLKTNAWIPGKDGVFRKPQDMTQELLPDEFPYDNRNGLLTAIGFGKKIAESKEAERREQERQTSEYKRKEESAKDLGFDSAESATHAQELLLAEKEGRLRLMPKPAFPERPVANPERRQEKVSEQLSDAQDKGYERRLRSVRTTANTIDATAMLRGHYMNADGQMICQICKEEMPFRKRDGAHYFEKKEVLSKKYLPKEHEAQYLALCPLCAAKYDEFVKTDDEVMAELREEIVSAEDYEIPISLGDEKTSIRFVETHLHDLKVIMDEAE